MNKKIWFFIFQSKQIKFSWSLQHFLVRIFFFYSILLIFFICLFYWLLIPLFATFLYPSDTISFSLTGDNSFSVWCVLFAAIEKNILSVVNRWHIWSIDHCLSWWSVFWRNLVERSAICCQWSIGWLRSTWWVDSLCLVGCLKSRRSVNRLFVWFVVFRRLRSSQWILLGNFLISRDISLGKCD